MDPLSYATAIDYVNRMIKTTGIIFDSLDVGGGFPASYPGLAPAPMAAYMAVIDRSFKNSLTSETCSLLCEPGRALVAESASGLANVTLRKGDCLYLNDGAYGALFDAAQFNFPYPLRAIRNGELIANDQEAPFRFFGPTCDSIDYMPGPFMLPANIQAGDYIEIGQLGAYGDVMRTDFNGFRRRQEIIVADEPMLSLYVESGEQRRLAEW